MIRNLVNSKEKINFFLLFLIVILLLGLYQQNNKMTGLRNDLSKNFQTFKEMQSSEREDLKKQLSLLREELIRYKSQQEGRDQILALSLGRGQLTGNINNFSNEKETPTVLSATSAANSTSFSIKGIVKLKKNWEKADVYSEKRASSRIIGQIVKDKLYFVYEIVSGWYQIEYQDGQFGWIQGSLVDEI